MLQKKNTNKIKKLPGPTETRTRIAGFRVRSANHYTIGPCVPNDEILNNKISFEMILQMAKYSY